MRPSASRSAIGLDAFDKRADYDPRKDATVRLHVSRLRQKLADYYRGEGQNDPILVSLPKERVKLTWQARAIQPEQSKDESPASPVPTTTKFNATSLALTVALTCSLLVILFLVLQLQKSKTASAKEISNWTPELKTLWQSVHRQRPPYADRASSDSICVAFPGPNGIRHIQRAIASDLGRRGSSAGSPGFATRAWRCTYEPTSYVSRGEVQGTFLLGKLFGSHGKCRFLWYA